MPAVDDYSDDEDQPAAGGSRHVAAAAGGSESVAPTPQHESDFVPWSRFVNANADVSQRNAGKLNAQVSGDVSGAQKEASDATDSFNKQIESNYTHATDPQPTRPPDRIGGFGTGPTSFGQPSQAVTQGAAARAPQAVAPAPPPSREQLAQGRTPGQVWQGQSSSGLTAAPQPGTRTGLKPGAENNPAGSKDLETSMGADAWGRLMGDTTHAQSEAGAIGSETGVQGLIQQQTAQPLAQNGAFDAALVNGAGGKAFGQTAKAGAGLGDALTQDSNQAQNAWHSLMGDVNDAKFQNAATAEANATNAANAQPAAGAAQGADGAGRLGPAVEPINGAAGVFWNNDIPKGFDPSGSPQYQQALKQLQTDVPLPPGAETPAAWMSKWGGKLLGSWAQQLGISPADLSKYINSMPQWEWELFARGIVPADLQRGTAGDPKGYFSGFSPVAVDAQGNGTDKDHQWLDVAANVMKTVVTAVANANSGGAAGQLIDQGAAAAQSDSMGHLGKKRNLYK